MVPKSSVDLANSILAILLVHPEVTAGDVLVNAKGNPEIQVSINVEMALPDKAKGKSPTGVKTSEPVTVRLPEEYPWKSPSFYLREDFPRNFPHLQPSVKSAPPRPCLVDGYQDEYFRQFDLHEFGLLALVDQLVAWLEKAAMGNLNNPLHGWEPILRVGISSSITVDAKFCRDLVTTKGCTAILPAKYLKKVDDGAPFFMLYARSEKVPLKQSEPDVFTELQCGDYFLGSTAVAVVSPSKMPSGKLREESEYRAEDLGTYEDLLGRAREYGCLTETSGFLKNISRYFINGYLDRRIPVGLVYCVRRPFNLCGLNSNIELVPYIFEIFPVQGRTQILENGKKERIYPVAQIEAISKELLRSVSALGISPPTAILGCGSVGSKTAMHLARAGVSITSVSDNGYFRAHNMARHALVRDGPGHQKARELEKELATLDQEPQVFEGNIVAGLTGEGTRREIVPSKTDLVVNTTASLGVREAVCECRGKFRKTQIAEMALFGRGEAGILLLEGPSGNPNLCDLMTSFHAMKIDRHAFELLHDSKHGLTEIQIGQGCHSSSMPMSDMRLSAMTATMAEELLELHTSKPKEGRIVFGHRSEFNRLNTKWNTWSVPPFETIPIEGADGWVLRISQNCLKNIRKETASYATVETGGVIVGSCSARLKTVCVVDTLPAPEDSERLATKFILGRKGLKRAIQCRFDESGGKLFDLGTWHSHLVETGPSQLDWSTANDLAEGRPPPSVLLIATPTKFYAISRSIG